MFNTGEFYEISNSKDVQLLISSIQRRGERLLYLQGCISMGIAIAYELLHKMYRRKETSRFEGMGCLICGILSLASKIRGSYRRVCKALVEAHIDGPVEDYGKIRRIYIGMHEVIFFTTPETDRYREITTASLLQTEVVICTLFRFKINFPDCHDILWKRLHRSKASSEAKKASWIILTDILSFPFLCYFSPYTIIISAEYISDRIHNEKHIQDISDKPELSQVYGSKELADIAVIEEELIKRYKRNCELSEEFIDHKENRQDLEEEDVNEK